MVERSPDGGSHRHHMPKSSSPPATVSKGKSCKGCLYYSSVLKSNGRNPRCVGLPRSLPQVPLHIVGESEMEATEAGSSLLDFKYACVGYSVYQDNKDNPNKKGDNHAELPFCSGIELLVARRAATSGHAHPHKEEGPVRSQPRPHKPAQPAHPMGDEFFTRFTRNAGLVASGVARNMNKVGNYIKDTLDDMMYPYRRRPK